MAKPPTSLPPEGDKLIKEKYVDFLKTRIAERGFKVLRKYKI